MPLDCEDVAFYFLAPPEYESAEHERVCASLEHLGRPLGPDGPLQSERVVFVVQHVDAAVGGRRAALGLQKVDNLQYVPSHIPAIHAYLPLTSVLVAQI
eukprot:scaffold549614_cov31-Prasinocladus_malaysianus.AAC.1